eukprot:1731987-Prymnesium_polylepis.1
MPPTLLPLPVQMIGTRAMQPSFAHSFSWYCSHCSGRTGMIRHLLPGSAVMIISARCSALAKSSSSAGPAT